MFNTKIKNILIGTILILLFLITPTYAAKIETGDNYTLNKEEIIEDDLYVSGSNITISGIVDGDLLAAGENILVDGTVTGDIYSAGNSIKITGNVSGNTFVVSSNATISAILRKNLYITAAIADVKGSIEGDLMAAAGQVNIEGVVLEDVRVIANQLKSTASVGEDFLVSSSNYSIDESSVAGEVVHGGKQGATPKFTLEDLSGIGPGLTIINFMGMYLAGLIIILLAPVKTLKLEKKITSSWRELLKSYAIGIAALIVGPTAVVVLLLTGIGAPIALLITAALAFLSMFGTLYVESAIGHKILKVTGQKDYGRFFSLLIGRCISLIISFIPVLRGIYSISLISIAIGSAVRMKYDSFPKQTKEETKTEVKEKKK